MLNGTLTAIPALRLKIRDFSFKRGMLTISELHEC